ncbi:hypothetical protein, partial [Bradyrhizobium sp. CCBAU 65884]|uniref:hypothetical protein n=1 Tax=Bradyrhizobium sp. CCBAU 65884 TaxID=722477 RepID=UPI0023068324
HRSAHARLYRAQTERRLGGGLMPVTLKLPSSVTLAFRHRSSLENSWKTTVGRSRHSALSFVAAGLIE